MSYPEFREEILKILKGIVSEDISLEIVKVKKNNNQTRYGVSFRKDRDNFSPNIYLEPFYRGFQKGEAIETIAAEILECYKTENITVPENVCKLEQFDSAKPYIFVKMIHLTENQSLLAEMPHVTFLDFAIVAYFEVESEEIYKGTVLIKNQYLTLWKISEKELMDWAITNTKAAKGFCLHKMSEILSGTICPDDRELLECAGKGMYVLTNKDKYFGAPLAYYPDVLKEIGECIGEDYYLLPASVHEWVLVADSYVCDKEALFSMVRDINDFEVSKEEILSYNVYFYNISSQKIQILEQI